MIQLYEYICGNLINNNDERTHFFRKIYLSHFIRKGCEMVVCERWVEDWTDCNILTPSSSDYCSTSFSFCWATQPGFLRAQALCWGLVLTASNCISNFNSNWLQLTRIVCGTGLYNCLTSTCFLWASHLHRIQPVHISRLYLDVFDRMHQFLDWRLGRRSICYKHIVVSEFGLQSRYFGPSYPPAMCSIERLLFYNDCFRMK